MRTTLRGCAAVDRFPTERVAEFLAAGVPKQSAARSCCGDGTEASARSRAYKDRCQLGAKGTADAAMEVSFQDCSKSVRGEWRLLHSAQLPH